MSDTPASCDPRVDLVITERVRDARPDSVDLLMADDGDDGEEALEFARAAAVAEGVEMVVLWCPEQDEFRAGPAEHTADIAFGSPCFEVVAVVGPLGDRALPAVEAQRRMPAAVCAPRLRETALYVWAHRDRFTDGVQRLDELLVKRRARLTRIAANRKSLKTMDASRRKTARRAKVWRMKNKSKARRYKTLYHGPKRSLTREDIEHATADRLSGRPLADIADDMVDMSAAVVTEAARDISKVLAALRARPGWVSEGWDRTALIREIDPEFIHHAEHYDRLMHGGHPAGEKPFPGGGGLRWGGLVVSEGAVVLRVMGSFEYGPKQDIYQQTIRFANYERIAEATELTWPEKARVLLTQDKVRLHCDCPAFAFYHQHAATSKGFALIPEARPAPVNNPEGKSGVCKHLNVVLKWLGAQGSKMASEMKQFHGDQ